MGKLLPYLSFQGRANRQRYWLILLVIYAIILVGGALAGLLGPVASLVFAPVFFGVTWAALALSVRRLHDRGKSGWWLLVMMAPAMVFDVLGEAMFSTSEGLGGVFYLLSLPFSIWMLVEFGFLKGTVGPNRFGPDPLRPAAVAEAFS